MIKIALSMLLTVALPFAMVGCMADPTTESESESEYGDDQAEESEESVGEAQQGITAAGLCRGDDILPTGYRLCFGGPCSSYGNGTAPANVTCDQYPTATCQVMYGPNQLLANVPCHLAGGGD